MILAVSMENPYRSIPQTRKSGKLKVSALGGERGGAGALHIYMIIV